MSQRQIKPGVPFRPDAEDLKAIAEDVFEIGDIQKRLLNRHGNLHVPDRVAHQYQIAGGKVVLRVDAELPAELDGVGLFRPGAEHFGIGRVSTGLGTPHLETNPDFLGLMFAFRTEHGDRVDFLGINDPAAPTDNHREFMAVLHATGESAGAEIPFLGDWGEYDVGNLIAEQKEMGKALLARMGLKAPPMLAHLVKQSARTFRSSTAYQAFWTGIVEVEGTLGKFTLVPTKEENAPPKFRPGERHLSEQWKNRQKAADVEYVLYWIPFLNTDQTPTDRLTERWEEAHKQAVGRIVFPKADLDSDEARSWATLASEMGANPGNWVRNRENSIEEPATEFETARKIAYRRSQEGRGALDPTWYDSIFETGAITPDLARELKKRREGKEQLGHMSWAPQSCLQHPGDMGAREIATHVDISAPPSRVWDLLVDTPRYPQWNPFIVELQGELADSQDIKFFFRMPPAPRLPGRATVLRVVPRVELRWAGRLIWTWLFRAEHYHLLTPIEGGRTRFAHGEIFSGVVAVLAWPLLRYFARPAYVRFNEALRERVEQMPRRSTE